MSDWFKAMETEQLDDVAKGTMKWPEDAHPKFVKYLGEMGILVSETTLCIQKPMQRHPGRFVRDVVHPLYGKVGEILTN